MPQSDEGRQPLAHPGFLDVVELHLKFFEGVDVLVQSCACVRTSAKRHLGRVLGYSQRQDVRILQSLLG